MTMTPGLRKFVLTAHVTCSVAWIGAAVSFLALAICGLTSRDGQQVRAVYVAMELSGWWVIVPLSITSLLTGVVASVGTTWGLVRHYWVLFKLLINVFGTLVLLNFMRIFSAVAGAAISTGDFATLRSPSAIVHVGVGLVLLVVAVTLSVYKPRGRTQWAW